MKVKQSWKTLTVAFLKNFVRNLFFIYFIIESCTKHKQNNALRTVQRSAPTNESVHQNIEVHQKQKNKKWNNQIDWYKFEA